MKKLSLLLAALLVCCALIPAMAEDYGIVVVPAESLEDFYGSWEACAALVDPFMMKIDESRPFRGYPATLEIGEGGIALSLEGTDYALTGELNADGALETIDEAGDSRVFCLNNDGTISLDLVVDGTAVTLYFQSAAD